MSARKGIDMLMGIQEFRENILEPEIGRTCDGYLIASRYGDYIRENVAPGDGMTVHYWTDSNAYTVIKKTKCTLTLQRDKATLSPGFKPDFVVGGFAAHCTNQHEQTYTYERDPNGRIIVARWSQKKHGYYWDGLHLTAGRHEFYDYNF